MMIRNPGNTAPLHAVFINGYGARVDIDPVTIDIFDPNNVKVIDNAVPERLSTGYYRYVFNIPEDAVLGSWRIEWTGTLSSVDIFADELFTVTDEIIIPTDSLIEHLRQRLGEPKMAGDADGSDTFFSDDALEDILNYAEGSIDGASLEGWLRKQARFARLIDVRESGTDREMSQKFKAATAMVAFWRKIIGDDASARSEAQAGRVVGRVVRLNRPEPFNLDFPPFPKRSINDTVVSFPDHQIIVAGT